MGRAPQQAVGRIQIIHSGAASGQPPRLRVNALLTGDDRNSSAATGADIQVQAILDRFGLGHHLEPDPRAGAALPGRGQASLPQCLRCVRLPTRAARAIEAYPDQVNRPWPGEPWLPACIRIWPAFPAAIPGRSSCHLITAPQRAGAPAAEAIAV